MRSRENKLLGRKELVYLFKGVAGSLSRESAKEHIASKFSVPVENVIPVKLETLFGTRDIRGLFYIYRDVEEARRQLPGYLFLRGMRREERAKVLEEKRKAKAAARRR